MLYPSINELRKKVDSKYTLVIMTSKRARDIVDGKLFVSEEGTDAKPVSLAAQEIYDEEISYTRPEEDQQ